MSIPVLDFGVLGLESGEIDVKSPQVKLVAQQVVEACSTVGFVYLKNHGIKQEELQKASGIADEFLSLPLDVKARFIRKDDHGYIGMEMQTLDPRFKDLKECYNIAPWLGKVWPDEVVPGFKENQMNFYKRCDQLAHRILKSLAIGLGIKDVDYFNDTHKSLDRPNRSSLRFLYYPPIHKNDIKPDQVRLGEHTDWGSISLLFQDNNGGLEVQTVDKTWIPATPVPGAVLVNIGDVMQRWTADKLVSTPHRLYEIPSDENGRPKERRSIAFFARPDEDVMIECIDGSNKYPPVSQRDYLDARFSEAYPGRINGHAAEEHRTQ